MQRPSLVVKYFALGIMLLFGEGAFSQTYKDTVVAKKPVAEYIETEAFVTLSHVRGYRYNESDISEVEKILVDKKSKEYWEKAIATLAYIGSPKAIGVLANFMANSDGKISKKHYVAVNAVPRALGFLAATNPELVSELIDIANKKDGKIVKINFTVDGRDKQTITDEMANSAIMGLGFSGDVNALVYLQAQEEKSSGKSIEQAIALNRRISELGQEKVFSHDP